MNAYSIIDKKKKGIELSENEIKEFIEGYTFGTIPDYQMSAFLMAVYFSGMTDRELKVLTCVMRDTGYIADLSGINGIKVDKHSTGGVGDKTTLVVGPVVAACGGKVAKMSGRGLGFTGGTIDKLESIPGFNTEIDEKTFFDIVNRVGVSVIGQSKDIALADKKMYALRDVTATVDSIPLIASSIMSKKLASGSDRIVLDVTVGSGAFMKDEEHARELASKMVAIGNMAGKKTIAILSNMGVPLGRAVGNNLEVIEAIDTLKGNGPEDFNKIVKTFSSYMLTISDVCKSIGDAEYRVGEAIKSGKALEVFKEMVRLQGGDISYIDDPGKFTKASCIYEVKADKDGFVTSMDTEMIGRISGMLGAGREKLDSVIDGSAGIIVCKKTGDRVENGETLAVLHTNKKEEIPRAEEAYRNAIVIGGSRVEPVPEILGIIE